MIFAYFEDALKKFEKDFEWLLKNTSITGKRAFIFSIESGCDLAQIEAIKGIKETTINERLRNLLYAKRDCPKTLQLVADYFGMQYEAVNPAHMINYFQEKMNYFQKMWLYPPPKDLEKWKKVYDLVFNF